MIDQRTLSMLEFQSTKNFAAPIVDRAAYITLIDPYTSLPRISQMIRALDLGTLEAAIEAMPKSLKARSLLVNQELHRRYRQLRLIFQTGQQVRVVRHRQLGQVNRVGIVEALPIFDQLNAYIKVRLHGSKTGQYFLPTELQIVSPLPGHSEAFSPVPVSYVWRRKVHLGIATEVGDQVRILTNNAETWLPRSQVYFLASSSTRKQSTEVTVVEF